MSTCKCRFHCRCCDNHFDSLEAFDAHRIGTFKKGRRCRPDLPKVDKLRAHRGTCDIVPMKTKTVRVYALS